MDPIRSEMSATGAPVRIPELMAVSDAVNSPDMDTKVKFGLVDTGSQTTNAAETESEGQPESDPRGLIEDSIRNINSELEMRHISLSFSIDEDSERIVVQVVESESGKVIRQIPPDEILALRRRLEELTGIMFDASV